MATPDYPESANSSLLSIRGRCPRSAFLLRYIPGMLLVYILKFTAEVLTGKWSVLIEGVPMLSTLKVHLLLRILIFLLSVILLGPLVIRRLHDVGFSAAFYIIGASGRLLSLALPLIWVIYDLPAFAPVLILTICIAWGWLFSLIYFCLCLLPSQAGSNDYGTSP